MLYKILILIVMVSSCEDTDAQNKKTAKQVKVAKQASSFFNGNFDGINAGKSISISLKTANSSVTGLLMMNGESAQITGKVKLDYATGQIKELGSGKVYSFTAERKVNDLLFYITFPEYNNQVVKMELKKVIAITASNVKRKIDQSLVGTWRNTEVISSGSGEFYSSFSTDYFVSFNANGTALIWSGKSAGGTKDVLAEANGSSKAQRMEWYTNGKNLFFVDPVSKRESAVAFYAEPNRMMLSTANSKKVYHRIQ